MFNKQTKQGFTLIELLVVVLIIGILASVALPQYTKAVEKSRAAEAWTTLKSIKDAANAYYLENDAWPNKFEDLPLTFIDYHGQSATGPILEGKYFNYTLLGPRAAAERVSATGGAMLNLTSAGKRACWAFGSSPENIKFCKAVVGSKLGTDGDCISGEAEHDCYVE